MTSSNEACPVCGTGLVTPYGRPRSPILLIGETPGQMEINTGRAWISDHAEALRNELRLAGVDMRYCRATYLWLHSIPPAAKKGEPDMRKMCYDAMFDKLMLQVTTARAILLMGSELVSLFTNHPVSKVSGTVVHSTMLKAYAPGAVVIASYSPGIILQENGVVGDFRLAVQRFAAIAKPMITNMLQS